MPASHDEPPVDASFRRLYPELSEAALGEAEENFERYLEGALLVYERILKDPDSYAQFVEFRDRKRSGRSDHPRP